MADTSWKALERRVARFFGATRQRCSGSSGIPGQSRSDSTHERLYVECKQKARTAVRTLYDDTKIKAKKERKVPVVCVADKNRPGFLVVVHSDDLDTFIDAYRGD